MAFATKEEESSYIAATGLQVHPVTLPGTINNGDRLFLGSVCNFVSGVTYITPSGWTALGSELGGSSDGFVGRVFYRDADGTEGATQNIDVTASTLLIAYVFRFSGHNATAPEIAQGTVSTSTAPDPPSLNPSGWGAEDTTWLAMSMNDAFTATVYDGFPTSYSDTGSLSKTGGGGHGLAKAFRDLNAASEDPGAFSLTVSEQSVGLVIAIRPAAAVTGQTIYHLPLIGVG